MSKQTSSSVAAVNSLWQKRFEQALRLVAAARPAVEDYESIDWLPYQRDSFVSPAFAGYVSGHSGFSRAAADILTAATGNEFFPGGMFTHDIAFGAFLHEALLVARDIDVNDREMVGAHSVIPCRSSNGVGPIQLRLIDWLPSRISCRDVPAAAKR